MQSHISESLSGLPFREKYNLTEYIDSISPLIIFGMYRPEDLDIFSFHKSDITLVWQGMDAKDLSPYWIEKLKARPAKHYAISHWIKNSLDSYGIESELKPISATISKNKKVVKGRNIYFYSSDLSPESADYYGEYMIEEIKKRTQLNVIRTVHGQYPKSQMDNIYRECFINLRLTSYDGCPNTNLEMGLMGIRSVFNGDIPGSIKWESVDDVCEAIWNEYTYMDEIDISEDIKQFLNITFP